MSRLAPVDRLLLGGTVAGTIGTGLIALPAAFCFVAAVCFVLAAIHIVAEARA